MAMTHDYLDQLDQNVGIAPANSQEEYQAAQTIADIMRRHGVEPSIEEFDAKAFGGVMDQILFAMLFVGMLLVGIGAVPLTVIGFVLVALPVAAFVARYLGNDFVEKLGPSARSQNVVAFHKGEGPLVQKGVRPIVVVAHYDTPHENPVYSTPLAPYLPMAWRFSKWCVLAVAVATLFQIMAFLPEAFRRILWVLGLIAALPLLLLAVTGIVELFTPSTEGANDNKTGVAAMLGILQNVRPSDERSAYPANEDPADWVPAEPAFDAVSSYDDASAVDGAAGETPRTLRPLPRVRPMPAPRLPRPRSFPPSPSGVPCPWRACATAPTSFAAWACSPRIARLSTARTSWSRCPPRRLPLQPPSPGRRCCRCRRGRRRWPDRELPTGRGRGDDCRSGRSGGARARRHVRGSRRDGRGPHGHRPLQPRL